jgi:pimeloyl-ACP methyl ester carboxylesterase
MILHKNRAAGKLVLLGILALSLSVALFLLVGRNGHTSDLTDFGVGVLFGVAIGLLIVALIRSRSGGTGQSAAALLLVIFAFSSQSCATAPHPQTIALKSGSVFVDDGGRSGAPILFVHGNGGSSDQWRAQLAHFRSAGRRAAAIDLPGFGRSAAPSGGDESLDAMASAIDDAASAIHLDHFVIVGHSYAGAVVAKYAALHPSRVSGVVYVDAVAARLPMSDEQMAKFASALRANKMSVVRAWFAPMLQPSSDAVRKEVLASVERTPVGSLIGALTSLTTYDAITLVEAYTGPRLAIVAADLKNPVSFEKQFPVVPAVAIHSAGHWLMLDKPDEVNAALDAFLATIDAAQRR